MALFALLRLQSLFTLCLVKCTSQKSDRLTVPGEPPRRLQVSHCLQFLGIHRQCVPPARFSTATCLSVTALWRETRETPLLFIARNVRDRKSGLGLEC